MRELVVKAWCGPCFEEDRLKEDATFSHTITLDDGVKLDVDMCSRHSTSASLAQLPEILAKYGTKSGARPRRRRRVRPPVEVDDELLCPECLAAGERVQARSVAALGSHRRYKHGVLGARSR